MIVYFNPTGLQPTHISTQTRKQQQQQKSVPTNGNCCHHNNTTAAPKILDIVIIFQNMLNLSTLTVYLAPIIINLP